MITCLNTIDFINRCLELLNALLVCYLPALKVHQTELCLMTKVIFLSKDYHYIMILLQVI